MSPPISDYALVGDTRTTALISRDGSVDWLCWPRHDSPALFLRLLDAGKGGACTIAFDAPAAARRRYLPDTNILETVFEWPGGRAVLTDFMPLCASATLPEQGPDADSEGRLIRILLCQAGTAAGRFTVRPTFDYARLPCTPTAAGDGSVLFEAGEHRLRVLATHPAAVLDQAAVVPFRLEAGERLHLVLTAGQDGRVAAVDGPDGVDRRLRQTAQYWREWIGRCRYDGPQREAVRRSALVLKLLTYAPTGAIIAAPTAALPEAVPGNRNFDYRYAWLRDASFITTAFVNLGYYREAEEYLRFLRQKDGTQGRELRLVYGIDGDVPAEEVLPHLSGWRGVGPVSVGNAAAGQTQHDIYGELLLALGSYLDATGSAALVSLRSGLPELIGNLAERAMEARGEPDQGIWEVRSGPQHFLHSKALIWVALDRAARIGGQVGGIPAADLARWGEAARSLRAEYLDRGWNEARGTYTQAYGSEAVDAAILRTALFGALPLDDGRLQRSLAVLERDLGAGDLMYRYRVADGMEGEEATFAACAFWFTSCLALTGRGEDAGARFARLVGRANDLGLFAEQIDAATGEHRGNFPQGFTHMAVINHAVRLVELARPPGREPTPDAMAEA